MNFFLKYKKIFFITGFILLVFMIGYALYLVFFKPMIVRDEDIAGGEDTIDTGSFPKAKEGEGIIVGIGEGEFDTKDKTLKEEKTEEEIENLKKIKIPDEIAQGGVTKVNLLVDTPSKALNPYTNDGLLYYNELDYKFYKINKNGDKTPLSDKRFYDVENVIWSPTKDIAIIEYPDGSNIIYDFENEKQNTLPKHWEDFNFSTTGNKILAKSLGIDPENHWLIQSDITGKNIEAIEHLGYYEEDVIPSWSPNEQIVGMYTRGVDFNRQEVFFIGLHGENFKSTIIQGRGFQPKWNSTGKKLVYSVYSSKNDLKPSLWVVDAKGESIGQNRKPLNAETWADKCTFSGENELYCAIPEKLEKGAGMFREAFKAYNDQVYEINLNSGQKRLVAIPEGGYNMKNLTLSEDGSVLYFTDDYSYRLQSIELR